MPREIEAKFRIADPVAFRRSLRGAKAVMVSKELERDVYFRLRNIDPRRTVIRLRRLKADKGVFTVKESVRSRPDRHIKVKDEYEVSVGNAGHFSEMLVKLGFEPCFIKEKVRETYELPGAKVLLDKLPYIGYYAEIEASREAIKKTALCLGLDMKDASSRTYIDIFERLRRSRGIKITGMVFTRK